MTSKSSFFDLMKENFKRRIALPAIATLMFFFVMPIASLLVSDNYLRQLDIGASAFDIANAKAWIYRDFINTHNAAGGLLVLLILLALISGISAFSYLHNGRKTDFYHSLPISRNRLFAVATVNSILMVGIPYLIMAIASALIIGSRSGHAGCLSYALMNYLYGMCFFILFFATTVLAMMLTGTKLTGIMGTAVLLSYGPAVYGVIEMMKSLYYWSYYQDSERIEEISSWLSPVTWASMSGSSMPVRALVSLAAAAVLMAASLMLYRMRRSEAAGTSMAFKKTEAPIKLLITVPAALAAGALIGSIAGNSDAWTVFAIVAATVIVHCIIEIIYNADFKKLFAHKPHMAICLIISLAVFAFFRFDVSGFDDYVPEDSKIESSAVYSSSIESIYGNEDNVVYDDEYGVARLKHDRDEVDVLCDMRLVDTEAVKAVASAGIARIQELRANGAKASDSIYNAVVQPRRQDGAAEESQNINMILLAWHLNNGKTVYRHYSYDLADTGDELEKICNSHEFKTAVYPILTRNEEYVKEISGVNYKDEFGCHRIDLGAYSESERSEIIAKLFETYTKELSELSIETRRKESPVAALQFKHKDFQAVADEIRKNDGYLGMLNDSGYYPLYPSFTETIKQLEEYGVIPNKGIDPDGITQITLTDGRGYYYDEDGSKLNVTKEPLIVTDKDEIREILDSVVLYVGTNNVFNPQYYGVGVGITFNTAKKTSYDYVDEESGAPSEEYIIDGTADTYSHETENMAYGDYLDYSETKSIDLNFDADKIPEFVKQYFEISDEQLSRGSDITAW